MADRAGVVGNIIKSPVLSALVFLLVLLVAGFAANFYLVNTNAGHKEGYLRYAAQLKLLSQEIAKNASAAAHGQKDALNALESDRTNFDTDFGYLRDGNPASGIPSSPSSAQDQLAEISKLWLESRAQVELILANKSDIRALARLAEDLGTSVSAIEAENDKIVASMLKDGAAANEVALAQRQNVLMERMSRTLEKIARDGPSNSLSENVQNDRESFKRVLNGMIRGDRQLVLDPQSDPKVRASLSKIAQLYQSINNQADEIVAKADNAAKARHGAQIILQKSPRFLGMIDDLSKLYSAGPVLGLASPFVGMALAGGTFIVILIISLLIYREASQSASMLARQNEQNQAAILQLLDELADLADGDLRVQATVTESFTGAIADSINFAIDQMRGLVARINQTSEQVSSAADATKSSVSKLSQASQRQAKEIADVSEAVNDMALSIDKVSSNAAESSSVAEKSVDIASKGAIVVQNTIDGMEKIRGQIQETAKRIKRLGESSQEIGDIVLLINDIADQTNILSLNAAIQASMAGDAGKGFAVVADEVQRLAERSGAAAKQISALVKTIQSDTNEAVSSMEQTTAEVVQGTQLAQDAGVSLGEIESVSKSLAEIIENISDAARQQAASAGTISSTMKSIEEITSQTTNGTRSTVIAVGNLANMTNELRSSVTGFKLPDS